MNVMSKIYLQMTVLKVKTSSARKLSELQEKLETATSINFKQCTVYICIIAVYLELFSLIYLILTSDVNIGFMFLLTCTLCIHSILASISSKVSNLSKSILMCSNLLIIEYWIVHGVCKNFRILFPWNRYTHGDSFAIANGPIYWVSFGHHMLSTISMLKTNYNW